MARKKSRPPQPAATDTVAVAEAPVGLPATDLAARVQVDVVVSPAGADAPPEERFRDTPLARLLVRAFRVCASLQLAIALLSLFAVCLAVATLLESAYSAGIAAALIYRTWWFALLLGVLAVNVLCAALKKYPWKRHQTGFLITHSGLLTLLGGGLLTALGGSEGRMFLLDTPDPAVHRRIGLSNKSHTVGISDEQRLEVFHLRPPADEKDPRFQALLTAIDRGAEPGEDAQAYLKGRWALPLQPGPFAWHDDEHGARELPWHLHLLHRLASPSPGFESPLGEQGSLTLLNFYPHTEQWPYKRVAHGKGAPVLRLRLTSPMLGRPMDRWVSLPAGDRAESSPIALEMLVLNDPALLPEFLEPPAPADMGPEGQLVLRIDGTTHRVPVHKDRVGKAVPLGDGRQVTLLEYRANFFEKDRPEASQPAVRFELSGPYGKTECSAMARLPHLAEARGAESGRVSLWYHFPDFRWGQPNLMGSVQFLRAPDGRIYHRVYGKDGLRQTGREIDPRDRDRVHELPWRPMDLRFQVTEYLPSAVQEDSFAVRNLRPGAGPPPRLRPTVRGRLSAGGQSAEFWVRQTGTPAWVDVGGEAFVVRYQAEARPVDFELTLKRARKTTDPNSNRPAGFQSDVVLTHGGDGGGEEHAISMNQPLRHGRYAVYQSSFEPLTDPRTHQVVLDTEGKAVSLSGLTVAHDPGLWLKYLGSALVVLGIVAMFWMRAYFFRRPQPAIARG